MKRIRSLLKGSSGASLIAVIIAIVFITAIGGIITQITITNIRMKEIESSGKKNFYSAETVVDDISTGLNNKASLALKDAYTEALSDYRNIMVTGSNIQENFSYRYMVKLKELLADSTQSVYKVEKPVNPADPSGEKKVVYESGKCKFSDVKDCLSALNQGKLIQKKDGSGNPINYIDYELDYENGVFVLKDLHITYDDKGYETNIHTDMVFHTPALNFKGKNIVKDFMKYSLIGDNQIVVTANSNNVVVDGNVYAGVNGIECRGMDSSVTSVPQFIGKTIVTRGDITASDNANWVVGSDDSKVWAANIIAKDKSTTVLKGTDFIEDDLALNGKDCTVSVESFYYGYNFQQEYKDEEGLSSNAEYSSAMMINGKNAKLDLTQTKYLMLAGRTYIQRSGSTPKDILMGESISVRSNQMAYFVPSAFVDADTEKFTSDGAEKCAKYMGLYDKAPSGEITTIHTEYITNNVNSTKPVTAYKYIEGANTYTVYYLNFASEQCANDFYAAYESGHRHDEINKYAENYVEDNALILGSGMLYTLKGNMLYRDAADMKLKEKKVIIGTDNWKKGGAYWQYVKSLAQSYKTLQTNLEQYSMVPPEKVRIYVDETAANPVVNKSAHSLVSGMINLKDFDDGNTKSFTNKVNSLSGGGTLYVDVPVGSPDKGVVLSVGDINDLSATGATGGVVICKGNVTVNVDFDGVIIATGTISIRTNCNITANEMKVSQMFSEDMMSVSPKYSDCFYQVNEFTESVIGQVKVDDFLTFDNWTKSKEN